MFDDRDFEVDYKNFMAINSRDVEIIPGTIIKSLKNVEKHLGGGKREFVKMCQVRRPKQPLKVPTPLLCRSLSCGTFSPLKITFL